MLSHGCDDSMNDHHNLNKKNHFHFHNNNINNNNTNLGWVSNKSTTRTMEEVWKDINLPTTTGDTTKGYRGFILQDFLAKPFSNHHNNDTHSTSVSSPSPPPPPPPPPPMLLNLNSGPDQLNFLAQDPTGNVVCPFDQVANSSSSGMLAHAGIRMLPATDRTGGDRRHKRMIKNRESAARSRARKQAYTNELENEVERLKEENAMLKRQQQQLQVATAAQMTKKRGLQRTSTAPF